MDRRFMGLITGAAFALLVFGLIAFTQRGEPGGAASTTVARVQGAETGTTAAARFGGASPVTVRELGDAGATAGEESRSPRRTVQSEPEEEPLVQTRPKRERQAGAREERQPRRVRRQREERQRVEQRQVAARRRETRERAESGVREERPVESEIIERVETEEAAAPRQPAVPTDVAGNLIDASEFREPEPAPKAERVERIPAPPRREPVVPRRETEEPTAPRSEEIVEGEEIITDDAE